MGAALSRLASLGSVPEAAPEDLLRSKTLVLATTLITTLATVWVITYAAFGLWIPASIPLTYQLVSLIGLADFAGSRRFERFRSIELAMMLMLPFLLQWTLGGFVASSGVGLWALVAPLGALILAGVGGAFGWFAAYLALLIASWAIDPALASDPADLPEAVRRAFFALNVAGVSVTTYFLLQYFVRQRNRAMEALDREHARSERLLLNVLPPPIADRLKEREAIADRFEHATVLFADVVGFTPFAESLPPEKVVAVLDDLFSAFDELAEEHGLEKIKTIGDAYMVAAGVPMARSDHLEAVIGMAIAMLRHMEAMRSGGSSLRLRIGIETGPVVAGVIGRSRFIYDVWGDTVNTASRMEHHGVPDRIQVTTRVVDALEDSSYTFEPRGSIDVKGKGPMDAWLLVEGQALVNGW
ncbi:MAG: adenylate/guanylate cyclase domain-containing protein [Actinomycetota bacterium]